MSLLSFYSTAESNCIFLKNYSFFEIVFFSEDYSSSLIYMEILDPVISL